MGYQPAGPREVYSIAVIVSKWFGGGFFCGVGWGVCGMWLTGWAGLKGIAWGPSEFPFRKYVSAPKSHAGLPMVRAGTPP